MQSKSKCLIKNINVLSFLKLTNHSLYLNKLIISKHFSSEIDSLQKKQSPFLKKTEIKQIIANGVEEKKQKNIVLKVSSSDMETEKLDTDKRHQNRLKKKENSNSEMSREEMNKICDQNKEFSKDEESLYNKYKTKVRIENQVFIKLKHQEKEKQADVVVPPKGIISVAGIRAIEISRIQNIQEIKTFLTKPQNTVLSLNEKNAIYDKLIKIIWNLNEKFDRKELDLLLRNFFSKFLAAVQASENHRVYQSVLNNSTPKILILELEDFYAKCLEDFIFKFPKVKSQVKFF